MHLLILHKTKNKKQKWPLKWQSKHLCIWKIKLTNKCIFKKHQHYCFEDKMHTLANECVPVCVHLFYVWKHFSSLLCLAVTSWAKERWTFICIFNRKGSGNSSNPFSHKMTCFQYTNRDQSQYVTNYTACWFHKKHTKKHTVTQQLGQSSVYHLYQCKHCEWSILLFNHILVVFRHIFYCN